MSKRSASQSLAKNTSAIAGYERILDEMIELLEAARRASARAVNAVMTATYWEIGRRIVESEQKGKKRAGYGEALLKRLAEDLTARFGRGFSRQNLQQMRQFYLSYPLAAICQTVSGKLPGEAQKALPPLSAKTDPASIAQRFLLPWSHYVRLMSVKNPEARAFYEAEALRGGWSVRQLERQIGSLFYERTALSRNKAAMLTKGAKPRPEEVLTPEEEIRDPFVLEFLGLKDEYSENELEEAILRHIEEFLLELGSDFTFVGRQRRLRIGNAWYRIDLLFFHRRLRCLLIIDNKLDGLTHADVGQMHLYCNYAREHWTLPDENPPVGLILCTDRNESLARYALDGLPNKILAAEYRLALPDEKLLAAEVEKVRRVIETRKVAGRKKVK